LGRSNLPLCLCTACSTEVAEPTSLSNALCKEGYHGSRVSPVSTGSIGALTCQPFALNFHSSFCAGDPERGPSAPPSDSETPENPRESWSIINTTPTGASSMQTTPLQISQSTPKPHSVHAQDSGSQVENRWWRPNLFSWSQYTVASQSWNYFDKLYLFFTQYLQCLYFYLWD